jgi:hypothetical protein
VDFVLVHIKRLVLAGRIVWTLQAATQMAESGLDRQAVIEAIVSATFVETKRSTSVRRGGTRERVHVLKSFTFDGVFVYVKGVIRKTGGQEEFYIIVSAKKAE